jgi:hypothetical protein
MMGGFYLLVTRESLLEGGVTLDSRKWFLVSASKL